MIEFQRVKKQYGTNTVVRDVSMQMKTGTITCLIGRSGSGKTTLLRMINRLVEPTEGLVTIDDVNVREHDPIHLRRRIGYVIQSVGLIPHFPVWRNIGVVEELKGRPSADSKERIDELLSLVGLDPTQYRHRFPGELSGGQQQRVGIARALMAHPPVLLMDEPFGALDPITRHDLQDELLALNEQLKKTIVVVTHDLTEAFKLGDKIGLLEAGELLQCGTEEQFMESPQTPFVESFIKAQQGRSHR